MCRLFARAPIQTLFFVITVKMTKASRAESGLFSMKLFKVFMENKFIWIDFMIFKTTCCSLVNAIRFFSSHDDALTTTKNHLSSSQLQIMDTMREDNRKAIPAIGFYPQEEISTGVSSEMPT